MLVAAIALVACSGADVAAPTAGAGGGSDTMTSTSDDGYARHGSRAKRWGEIVEVLNVESFVDGEPALSGNLIVRDAELSTDATGLVRFVFSSAAAECVLVKSSGAGGSGGGGRGGAGGRDGDR